MANMEPMVFPPEALCLQDIAIPQILSHPLFKSVANQP